jgi:hypothetical protein
MKAMKFCLLVALWMRCGSVGASEWIPLGHSLLDWVTSNSVWSIVMTVQHEATPGGFNTAGMNEAGREFATFDSLQSFIALNGARCFKRLGSPASARFQVTATSSSGQIMSVDTICDNGSAFVVMPVMSTIALPATITNASVQIGTAEHRNMTMPDGTPGLDGSLATNLSGRVRVVLTSDTGVTTTYTQYGNPILPAVVELVWTTTDIPHPPVIPQTLSVLSSNDLSSPMRFDRFIEWRWNIQKWSGEFPELSLGDLLLPAVPFPVPGEDPVVFDGRFQEWYSQALTFYNLCVSVWPNSPTGSYYMNVLASIGADTTVETSTNFSAWTSIGSIPWDSPSNSVSIRIDSKADQQRFYRARSY